MAAKSKKSAKAPMTQAHKAALAKGRAQSASVRRYLEALAANKRGPGRQRTPEAVETRIATIDEKLAGADPLARLNLMQEKKNLQKELTKRSVKKDISNLEKKFIDSAKSYGDHKGITYGTWRASGVSADVLKKAGISRTRS